MITVVAAMIASADNRDSEASDVQRVMLVMRFDSPDNLHPANPGYKLMADAVDLRLFRK